MLQADTEHNGGVGRARADRPPGQGQHLPVFWTLRQLRLYGPSSKFRVSQSKVKAMNELSTWMQSNWYALGNLFIEGAFLAAGVWFARKILRTLRASQEQVGALLKMSVAGTVAERTSSPAASERSFANASPYWLTPSSEVPAAPLQGLHESRPGLGHRTIVWLKTPMKRSEVAPWRRAIKWLQAPARS